ncbi:MAG: TonB-dependent receptor [Tunicatimonas sp.]
MMKRILLLMSASWLSLALYAQERTITGQVTDLSNGETLPGVNILVKGTNLGTVTDIEGNYRLTAPSDAETLVFSSVGYTSEEVAINNRSTINLDVSPDIQALQEIVVVGYGEQKKENLTGAVSTIDAQEINKRPVLSADQALQGIAPGVTVTPNAEPGSGATIRIRGLGTLGNNDPLVIIDGVPGSFDMVDPNNIESISVLKDAASAAIYGSRAAGGVIIVTTKRGAAGGIKVNYSGYVGIQQPVDLPEFLDADGYLQFYNEALENEIGTPQNFVALNPNNDTDWLDEILVPNPLQQQHALTVSGGNETIKSNVTLTHQNQDGLIANSSFKRYSLRANNDVVASNRLRFVFDINAKRDIDNAPALGEGVVFEQALRIPPIYAARNFDGSYGEGWNGTQNPLAMAEGMGDRETRIDLFSVNVGATVDLTEALSVDLSFAPQVRSGHYTRFDRDAAWKQYDASNTLLSSGTFLGASSLNDVQAQQTVITSRALLRYQKSIGKHVLNGLLGTELVDEDYQRQGASRRGFILPDFQVLGAGDPASALNEGNAFESSLLSYFGRVGYEYDSRYLLELNARYDGSSRFAPGQQWGFFPSISAGWRISEEDFFTISNVDEFKLRASVGQLGNQFVAGAGSVGQFRRYLEEVDFSGGGGNISNAAFYPYASSFNLGTTVIGNTAQPSGAITDVANSNLTWETTTMQNYGVDVTLFSGALSATADYYVRNTIDILLNKPISGTFGLSPAPVNAGEVKNTGWELSLGYRQKSGDFGYGITGVLSDVRNEIVSLDEGEIIQGLQVQREGQEINSIFGFETNGLLTETDLADGQFLGFDSKPGDIKYVDQNGDNQLDDSDRVIIGSTIPRFTYSLNVNLSYRQFSLTVFAQGVGKVDTYFDGEAAYAFRNTSGKITEEIAQNRWIPTNPNPGAAYPRLWQNTGNRNQLNSDFWVRDASYFKLRNVVLAYDVPTTALESIGMSSLRVYVSGQNVLNLDRIEGYDAEVPFGTSQIYPQSRIFALGVNASF